MSSITDVAERAGVSLATVSRVINNRGGVSEKRVRMVNQAIEELCYQPRPAFRRRGRKIEDKGAGDVTGARNIAVVILDGLYDHTPGLLVSHLRGIERGAAAHGLNVVVSRPDKDQLPNSVKDVNAAGLILMGCQAPPQMLREIEDTPSIWFGSHHSPTGDTVISGNYQVGQLAAKYLLDRGHKRMAFLSAMSHYPAYPARAETFSFVATRGGAHVETLLDEQPTHVVGDSAEMGTIANVLDGLVEKLLSIKPRLTGVFVPNDMMTAMIYPALHRRGVIVGKDIDIISCNNEVSYLIGLYPRPATIDIGAEVMGRQSIEQLVMRMNQSQDEDSRDVQVAVEPCVIESEVAWSV